MIGYDINITMNAHCHYIHMEATSSHPRSNSFGPPSAQASPPEAAAGAPPLERSWKKAPQMPLTELSLPGPARGFGVKAIDSNVATVMQQTCACAGAFVPISTNLE